MKLKEFKMFINNFDESYDDFNIDLTYCKSLSEKELKDMIYPYPYLNTPISFETSDYDIGYSDKEICLFFHDCN